MITSQIDTAPKRLSGGVDGGRGLITSQIDTAPKPDVLATLIADCLITSQIDTAPKRVRTPGRPLPV